MGSTNVERNGNSAELNADLTIDNEELKLVHEFQDRLKEELSIKNTHDIDHSNAQIDLNDDPESSYSNIDEQYDKREYLFIINKSLPFTAWHYMKCVDFNIENAITLAKSILAWRKEANVTDYKDSDFPKEFWHVSPVMYIGHTNDGKAIHFFIGRFYRRCAPILRPMFRRFVVHLVNKWVEKNRNSKRQYAMIFDSAGTAVRNVDLDYIKWGINLRDNFPNRCGELNIVDTPLLVRPMINMAIAWLPGNFKRVTKCGAWDDLVKHRVNSAELPKCAHGDIPDEIAKLAPPQTKWLDDLDGYGNNQKWRDAFEETLAFHVTQEMRLVFRKNQIDYEQKLARENNTKDSYN